MNKYRITELAKEYSEIEKKLQASLVSNKLQAEILGYISSLRLDMSMREKEFDRLRTRIAELEQENTNMSWTAWAVRFLNMKEWILGSNYGRSQNRSENL